MSHRLLPEVGHWYSHRDKGQPFQVVAVDEDAGLVETQDFDGDVDEFGLDDWYAMHLDRAEPPEDCSGPLDDVDSESGDAGADARGWRAPLEDLPESLTEAAEADEDGDPRR